ncbi:Keratin, type I cytoskeletal [Merluccius polli]|uniref:Keratin, type I cytoskeletal n=1 Tax=Merluccius polli TaxID=89951 RepID=A0AA47P0M4_MERPO|nr:Keratin, type I cytoskeletal [Merluccius polli]
MQPPCSRLATYMEKVRTLMATNAKLELQICQVLENKDSPGARDYSAYYITITDLQCKIVNVTNVNKDICLAIHDPTLTTDDFRTKIDLSHTVIDDRYESELNMRQSVEVDIAGLKGLLDELTLARSDLEMQIEGLRKELIFLKKNHEEAGAITKEVAGSTETINMSKTEITELSCELQALQIELQSQLSMKSSLEGTLAETKVRNSSQLQAFQFTVTSLEEQLVNLHADIGRQGPEYQGLLDAKTCLETEIAEYRRVLDGEARCVTETQLLVFKSTF